MDLVDLITEKRFLGQEFLTWLWFKSEERGGSVALPHGDILVVFEQHMLLEYGEGESHQQVICQGQQSELKEARTGLATGKKLEQARIRLSRDDHEWRLSLTGGLMEYRSVRPPKTMESAEEFDEAAREGRILDRIGLLEIMVRTVDELFRMFLKVRLSQGWEGEKDRIRGWITGR
jgi:recombination associated protein RdgC